MQSPTNMFALRKHSSSEWLSVTSTPVSAPPWFDGPAVELYVVVDAMHDARDDARALAVASMSRARRSEHDEVWAQLFIDGVFVDLARASDFEDPEGQTTFATFVARIRVPALYFDGQAHRAQVKFVSTVSRIVPANGRSAPAEAGPQAVVEAEFTAIGRGSLRQPRAAG